MPLHPFQIISWVIFALDVYAFYFVNMVTFSYHPSVSAIMSFIYTIIVIAVFYYGFKSTTNDPTDPTVYAQREADR
jgi:hypothetical protein